VCDVNEVVRVERDVNIVKLVFETSYHVSEPPHVVLCTWNVQSSALGIAEINLGIDD
jgi:hypothetical protein